jgi:signal transduction histidine kinase/CheY-like chemotaxis protein
MLSVEKHVFSEQHRTFLVMSMVMLVCVVVVVVILLAYVMISHNKITAANAETNARSRFLANMSHEIRTPLNGIIGLIYMIEKDIDDLGKHEVIKTRLSKAASTADYLLSLINNILDISKLQSGKIVLSSDIISPEDIADDILSYSKNNIENRGVEFVLEKNIVAPWIIGDAILIKRVLLNIVGNATKFTAEGGKITLSVTQQKLDSDHVTTVFTCSDTGCGMSEEFLEHIWDVFTQERRNEESSRAGTGLGMAISKLLVSAMDGEITVKSALGVGSTFTVTFNSEISHKPPEQTNSALTENSSRHLKILLAEDNELNSEILTEILQSEGIEVVCALNGQTAADIFAESRVGEFDVILMDMQMPVMDGCAATAAIRNMDRADAKSVLIFACTANSFKEDRKRALESGMNDFLSKPIDINEMLTKIGGCANEGNE